MISSENKKPLFVWEPLHLENKSPSLFGNLCILRIIFHYSSFNQLSSLVLMILRSHLQYFMTLIALAPAFSPSDLYSDTF